MTRVKSSLQGAGLGLRRSFLPDFLAADGQLAVTHAPDFLEVAPENWIGVGGRWGRQFAIAAEQVPVSLHGLSLNLGGAAPLDESLLQAIRTFMDRFDCPLYSEHLTACADEGHLYDLMPIPFTEAAVHHVADRIRRVQSVLGRRIAVENASYYASLGGELSEAEFITAVVEEADCDLLLDVNNIFVNSINHGYDASAFLRAIPGHRTACIHVAGHFVEAEDLRIDTHGADVIDPVWSLLEQAYCLYGIKPTLLERDFNIPALPRLLEEVARIRVFQQQSALS